MEPVDRCLKFALRRLAMSSLSRSVQRSVSKIQIIAIYVVIVLKPKEIPDFWMMEFVYPCV